MKKLSFLAIAALGLLFAACSSDKDVADQGGNPLVDAGVGYFKVNLNLPTQPVTRAWVESEQLDDGLDSEYAVDNVTLILFGGADEASAQVIQVNTLSNTWTAVGNTTDQVTTKHEEVVTLTEAAASATNLYALAVINAAGIIDANGANAISIKGTPKANATLADIRDEVAKLTSYSDNNKFINSNGHIFMTNAVLSNTPGGTSDPTASPTLHVLAPVNKTFIYETQAAAEAGTAATDIYVERGLAKVTLTPATTLSVAADIKKGTTSPTVTFEGWCLDNINARSYIVRKVPAVETGVFAWNYFNTKAGGDKYRFVGFAPVDNVYGTSAAGYRTYWALDPNYNETAAAGDLLSPAAANFEATIIANKEKTGNNYPQYCYENTFDVQRQMYSQTTSAIIKVTFSGGTFYTVGADRKTLYDEAGVGTLIANALMAQGEFTTYLAAHHATGITEVTTADLTISWSTDAAGAVVINDITIRKEVFDDDAAKSLKTDISPTLLATVQAQVANIKRYLGGATYYGVRIKHFGDDLTPWNSGELTTAPAEPNIETIYPGAGDDRNAAYLGRYSVVRNNWYDLQITGVLKIGSPTPEDVKIPDHPDDELEDAFIKARINILSWAKRTQNWALK